MAVSSFVTRFTFMVKLMVINVFQVCKNAIPRSVKALLAKLQNLMVFHWFSIWSEKVLEAAALHT